MSKILANQIANYGDDAPIEIKEGLNIPASKPIQAAGDSGTAGQILSSTGTTVEWIDNFSGSYNDLTNRPTIPAAQVRADWNAVGSISEILNKPVVPPTPSVVVGPVGTSTLSYNGSNGAFTFTPPDLSGYALNTNVANWDTAYSWGDHSAVGYSTTTELNNATANSSNWDTAYSWGDHSLEGYLTSYTETDPVFAASPASDILSGDITNWDTAYGWGDHSTEGYLTSLAVEDLSNVDITGGLADQQILKWDSVTSSWKPANDLVGGAQGIQLGDLSVSTAAATGGGALSYNNTNGVFTYTPPSLSGFATTAAVANAANWDAAYSWGDHSTEGYLTSFTETDPVFNASAAKNITTAKINQWDTAYSWGNHANGGYLVATNTDKTNWNTAYGWGDHSTEGYLTSFTETDPVFSASIASGISGTEVANWNTAYGWGDHSTEGYLTSTGSIDSHTDVTITSPTSGQLLSYNGTQWVNYTASSIAKATISDTAPGSPAAGDLWWESDKGRLKIYYNDTDSSQWVDASPPLQQDRIASTGAPATSTSTGNAGEIRYDSGYVYICVATDTWKRAALATW